MSAPDAIEAQPIQNLEAEQSCIGSMLIDREMADRCLEILRAGSFYREGHRVIYEAMESISAMGDPVDLVSVAESLRRRDLLGAVGGASYLASLADFVPHAGNAEYYARLVADKAVLRDLEGAGREISTIAREPMESIEGTLAAAEARLSRVGPQGGDSEFHPISELLVESYEALGVGAGDGGLTGVDTGHAEINALTGGFQPTDLVIIAARPSAGKTSLAISMAVAAARGGGPADAGAVAIFSLEMSRTQLATRMLCAEAGVSSHRMRQGYPREDDWDRLSDAMSRLSDLPIYVDDATDATPMRIRARCRRLRADAGLRLVCIDYLQLMAGSGRHENRQQEIAGLTRSLKSIARELQVPVICLSQLSRAIEQRQGKTPQLSDLRESGAIEADADLVMFIHRGEGIEEDDGSPAAGGIPTEPVEVIIGKQRNGPIGSARLGFQREFARFVDLAWSPDPA